MQIYRNLCGISFVELEITIQTNPDRSFNLAFGGKSFHVSGEIHEEGEGVKVTCSVDGVISKADVVVNNNTVHVFSTVSHSTRHIRADYFPWNRYKWSLIARGEVKRSKLIEYFILDRGRKR